MSFRFCTAVALLVLTGCQSEAPRKIAIVGATWIRSGAEVPVGRSIIIVEGGQVRAIGPQGEIPLPADSEKVDGSKKFVVASPLAIPAGHKIEKFNTVAEGIANLGKGHKVLQSIPTEPLGPALIARIRAGGVIVAPFLARFEGSAEARSHASDNVLALMRAGVPIASFGGTTAHREWQVLEQAGVAAGTILDSATLVAARALGQGERGWLAPGMRADLLILACNPLEHLFCLSKVERQMEDGRWVTPRSVGEH